MKTERIQTHELLIWVCDSLWNERTVIILLSLLSWLTKDYNTSAVICGWCWSIPVTPVLPRWMPGFSSFPQKQPCCALSFSENSRHAPQDFFRVSCPEPTPHNLWNWSPLTSLRLGLTPGSTVSNALQFLLDWTHLPGLQRREAVSNEIWLTRGFEQPPVSWVNERAAEKLVLVFHLHQSLRGRWYYSRRLQCFISRISILR